MKKLKKLKSQNIKDLEIDENFLGKLIENNYKKIGMSSKNEFNNFLKINGLDLNEFKKKLIIESLWNEIIYLKYKSKIKIDKNKIREEILTLKNKENLLYDLSEIVFNLNNNEKLDNKASLINKEILDKGFENTASIYSISSTSNLGGKLGWIKGKSLNKKLRKLISNLKVGEFTDPYVIPGGFLILKLNNIKKTKQETGIIKNIDAEIDKVVKLKTNELLKQFSNIYFNRIKKDIIIEKI